MWQLLKRTWWACLLAGGIQSASAFSMLGPFDTWQVSQLAYNVGFAGFNEGPAAVSDVPLGGPMNLGEEYRWNISTVNYAFDQSFLDYFGSNGVVAIEQAFAILNGLTNVSSYTKELWEVPQEATRINYRAQALGLLDLKSLTLHNLVEKMGLADPVRYTWCLRARVPPPGSSCPVFDYLVIKRNFDPVTWEPSSYVNGTLYTYRIVEFCPAADYAEAFEHRVDPLQRFYTAVASPGIFDGSFYTGLTRDDVGGLRYALRTNNVNLEPAPLGSRLIAGGITNIAARQLLGTSNLATLVYASLTNNPGALLAQFPGLILASTNTVTFTNVIVTNTFAYFTNPPSAPANTFVLVVGTNYTTNVAPIYHVTFANVVTNLYYTNGFVTTRDTTVGPAPTAPVGSTLTQSNVTETTELASFVNGDYYLVPPGLCDYRIVNTQLVTVIPVTNLVVATTNQIGGTNQFGTNVSNQSFTREAITYLTNYIFVVDPIVCNEGPAFHQGIEKISFFRQSYDSLLGQFFYPVTNRIHLTMVTNNIAIAQTFDRTVVQPDILLSADDLVSDPTAWPIVVSSVSRSIVFNSNSALPGLPGPGLIEPSMTIIYNKVGPSFENLGPIYLDEPSNFPFFLWGSFDGSTNAPVIYPSGTSIADYENLVLMQVSTSTLPPGEVGKEYTPQQLQGSGGEPPYSWALAPDSASLPPGLLINANGVISGTPTTAGTFNFTVLMTDSGGRSVTGDLSITVTVAGP